MILGGRFLEAFILGGGLLSVFREASLCDHSFCLPYSQGEFHVYKYVYSVCVYIYIYVCIHTRTRLTSLRPKHLTPQSSSVATP